MSWIRPTSHTANGWTDAANSYDGNTETRSNYNIGGGSWSPYLEFHFEDMINTDELRIYTSRQNDQVTSMQFDVYNGSGWTNVYDGDALNEGLTTLTFTEQECESVRIRFYRGSGGGTRWAGIHDVEFWSLADVIEGTAEGSGIGSTDCTGDLILVETASGSGISAAQVENPENTVLSMPYGTGSGGMPDVISILEREGTASGSGTGSALTTGNTIKVEDAEGSGAGLSSVDSEIIRPLVDGESTANGIGSGLTDSFVIREEQADGSGSGTALTEPEIVERGRGFEIERKVGTGPWEFLIALPEEAEDYCYEDAFTDGEDYTYRIRQFNGSTLSDWSNEVTITHLSAGEVGEATGSGIGSSLATGIFVEEENASANGVGFSSVAEILWVITIVTGQGNGTGLVNGIRVLKSNFEASGSGNSDVDSFIEMEEDASGFGQGSGTVQYEVEGVLTAFAGGSGVGSANVTEEIDRFAEASASGTGTTDITTEYFSILEDTGEASGVGSSDVNGMVYGVGEDVVHGRGIGRAEVTGTSVDIEAEAVGSGAGTCFDINVDLIFASGIEVQVSVDGSHWTTWDILKEDVEDICYTSNFQDGSIYRYRIRRFNPNITSDWSNVVTIIHDEGAFISELADGSGVGDSTVLPVKVQHLTGHGSGVGRGRTVTAETGTSTASGIGTGESTAHVTIEAEVFASGQADTLTLTLLIIEDTADASGIASVSAEGIRVVLGEGSGQGTGTSITRTAPRATGHGIGSGLAISFVITEGTAGGSGIAESHVIVVEPDLYNVIGRLRAHEVQAVMRELKKIKGSIGPKEIQGALRESKVIRGSKRSGVIEGRRRR